jgi:hypothetical protein
LRVNTIFFGLENGEIATTVNPVDLVVRFLWPCSTPQSEFPIKNYDCLQLRWSDFGFYLFCLSSLFIISFFLLFSVFLSSLFLYMKIDEKGLMIRGVFIFKFWFLDRWIGMNERWDGQSVGANVIGQMGYIRFLFVHEPLLTVFL